MANDELPHAPLFALGSPEQAKLDRFLARFPAEQAERMRNNFATGERVVAALDPKLQAEIDAIYLDLAARTAGDRPRLDLYEPGPVEEDLIQKFLATLPAAAYEDAKAGLYARNAWLSHPDPEKQRMLTAIYKARTDEAMARYYRKKGRTP